MRNHASSERIRQKLKYSSIRLLLDCTMVLEESMLAGAKQVLVDKKFEPNQRISFHSLINIYRSDMGVSRQEAQARARIEAQVSRNQIKSSECKLLEKDELAPSPQPKEVRSVELGIE